VVTVGGIGVAHPPPVRQDDLWTGFFQAHYRGCSALARRIFAASGVVTRHGVANPLVEDPSGWTTQARMQRYLTEAMPLGKEAVTAAMTAAGIGPAEIGLFIVCSCTGYVSPGLDVMLARDLGMAPDTRRLLIGHMGCFAALPGLDAAADFVTVHRRPAMLLCAELTSLHLQPATRDAEQIVVHALFSDAAAAVALLPDAPGLRVRGFASTTDHSRAEDMRWDITDHGFRMRLSPRVPEVLAMHVRRLVEDLLAGEGLNVSDVDGWAVHPGGPRVLSVVREQLGLDAAALAASENTLAAHGNCSSATVLLALDRLQRTVPGPRHVVMLAFGPGLTLYAALLSADR
jgi:alkylresorcinol/alkylpyrone synthase